MRVEHSRGERASLTAGPVAATLAKYRGGALQWAWAVHRIAGFGVFLFLALHIADICVLAFGPQAFDRLVFLYRGVAPRMLEIVLAFGLIYHALNGLRIVASDFVPRLAVLSNARTLFSVQLGIFVVLFSGAGFFMSWDLGQEPFHHNALLALVVTAGMILLPAAVILALRRLTVPRLPSRRGVAARSAAVLDGLLARGSSQRPRDGWALARWLFMRASGLCLVVLALAHLFLQHFSITVERIDYAEIARRWSDAATPLGGLFWRLYDLLLLVLAFTHGGLGVDTVLGDYVHGTVARRIARGALAGIWLVLILAGAGIIFLFGSGA